MITKSKIFLLALIVAGFSVKANADTLQPIKINDPIYNEFTDSPPEEISEESAATNEAPDGVTPLAEAPLNSDIKPVIAQITPQKAIPRSFFINESDAALNEKIRQELSENNITVSDMNFKRVGSDRMFGFDEVKKIILKSRFLIKNIELNKDTNEFTSVIKPQIGAYEIEVTGRFSAGIKIPIIAKTITKGTIITQEDLELKNYPKDKLTDDSIINISDLVGKSADKLLTKGMVVSRDDITNALLVRKGNTVSAIYRNNNIEVKALAIAQDDGSAGDVINLKNFDSGKGFKAVVQEDGTVAIEIAGSALSLNYAASDSQVDNK